MASASGARLAAIYAASQLGANQVAGTQALDQGYGQANVNLVGNAGSALNALTAGAQGAVDRYEDASSLYQPWADAGKGALGTLQDSLGLNGSAGNDNAVAAFRAGPGYQYKVDQATDAVARKSSALGMLGSGNTMAAISDRAENLADQEYGGWQDRLNGLSGMGLQATGAQAGLTKGIGDIYSGLGSSQAGIFTGLGSSLASSEQNHANQIANLGTQTALGQGSAVAAAGAATDKARSANSDMLTGGLLGLAGLGTKVITAPMTGGTSLLGGWLA